MSSPPTSDPQDQPEDDNGQRKYMVATDIAPAVVGGVAAVALAPVVVAAAGFGAGGIAAGSIGASMMSNAATSGFGMAAVSALQSAGAAGIGLSTNILVGAGGIAAGSIGVSMMYSAATSGFGMAAVSALQSARAAGIGLSTNVLIAAGSGGASIAAYMSEFFKHPNKNESYIAMVTPTSLVNALPLSLIFSGASYRGTAPIQQSD